MWLTLCSKGKLSYEDEPFPTEADDTYGPLQGTLQLNWSYYCGLDHFAGVWFHTKENGARQLPDWDINIDE